MTLVAHINLARGFRGGERQTELLVRGLATRGWRQRAVVRRDEPLAARLADVPDLDVVAVAGGVLQSWRALRGAGLIHVHEARALRAAWLQALTSGVPYLVTRRVQQGPSHHVLNRLMYRRAAGVVVLSQAIGASLHALDPGLSWQVIPSAHAEMQADPARSVALRARFGATLLVGHVGALVDAHKGQRQIVAVARELVRTAPDVGFVLVGSGRDEAMLRETAAGLPNLHFAGEVSEVGDYLAAFDVFLYPSRHEGLGSVLLDAMAFGLPVVATRVGGIPEVVPDGEAGFLCAVDDIAALAGSIMALRADPGLRGRIGAANRERAAHYAPQAMTQRYIDLYRELVPA